MNPNRFLRPLLLLLPFFMFGCAGPSTDDDDDDDGIAEVDDIYFKEDQVNQTDQINLRIDFSYDGGRIEDTDQYVTVLVRVPRELKYIEGTAHLEGNDDSYQLYAGSEECLNGDMYWRFPIGSYDLEDYQGVLGDSSTLLITVRGDRLGNATVEARAQYNEVYGNCTAGIVPDASTTITVVPKDTRPVR